MLTHLLGLQIARGTWVVGDSEEIPKKASGKLRSSSFGKACVLQAEDPKFSSPQCNPHSNNLCEVGATEGAVSPELPQQA